MKPLETTNEFVIRFANVNGTGSWSANLLFARTAFRMGIPVSPKNIFPSNIQGLPTWYEIRVSEKGYLGQRGNDVDIMVGMNPQSMAADVKALLPGGYFIYDDTKRLGAHLKRDDINYIGLPLTEMCLREYEDPKLRMLFKNIIYIGALAALTELDFEVLKNLISDQFKGKERLIKPNINALELGYNYAKENFECPIGIRVKAADKIGDRILIDGNSALGLGALYGGASVVGWYPITPSTSAVDSFKKYAERLRICETTGEKNYAVLQAEDELSAMGMVLGASWMGARAFTATSGPGVSLMSEFLGLAYFSETPAVLFNIQRAGPSTGMPTRTQQSDIMICAYASHGDTKHILLIPSDPKEAFDFAAESFDLAEQLQTAVIVLSDLDLSMNDTVSEPLDWDDNRKYKRGKILSANDLDNMTERFGRYLDKDGDGISYRTLPGAHPTKGAFFTRGSSHNEYAAYTENSADYVEGMQKLERKWITAKTLVPKPVIKLKNEGVSEGLVYFGTSNYAAREALDMLAEDGHEFDTMRLRAFPFNDEVEKFLSNHDKLYVIEQNRDGQMRTLLMNECGIDPAKLISVLDYSGRPITAQGICEQIEEHLGVKNKKVA